MSTIITLADKAEKLEVKNSHPTAYAFIKIIENTKITILFKTKEFHGKYDVITKEFFTIAKGKEGYTYWKGDILK